MEVYVERLAMICDGEEPTQEHKRLAMKEAWRWELERMQRSVQRYAPKEVKEMYRV